MGEFADAGEVRSRLDAVDYLVDDGMAAALFFATALGQPLLLEGEPGVGKTAAAKALALALDTPLIRLQCYEGLSAAEALYEWNYQRQLLAIRRSEAPPRRDLRCGSVLRRVPPGAADPARRAVRRSATTGPADRRDRPGGRRVRGDAVRVSR